MLSESVHRLDDHGQAEEKAATLEGFCVWQFTGDAPLESKTMAVAWYASNE